ncbi:ribonuclease h : Ribonuclease H OS=Thermosediminibacter oceani (strain ATCC BAA-1034 / DSM 16646 / JW/IW-1228P) GN=Toce_0936 PE=4 SV=1: RVT_3 [Gemmata massiliana]|uniref:RNase H type-1 domain-containing protein n=1 Tax=Gemmata massiliana TaxID=1210884 RepID=A0A6P2DLH4_9BACT|nr:ribonuclease HI family protein [Gemmata massiliana]VTS03689.1 ribonuclease h : Ribonuclease H OS=Thermosediminibacter oceani (strain ATCC BAA-1034 / DSM 16646 / JW/IW-1228P) GN=Toce_0936 PE=4 SV=1: RVT_3 [Gemmata massiliana]
MSDTATMHIDGASRGNPGPAAYAVVLARPGMPVVEEADTIGTASNNVAEYTALVEGLGLAVELGVKKLNVFSDSELMVKQMSGAYKVKNEDLRPLYEEACQLRRQFEQITITHVRREQNTRADAIGNDALDGRPRKRGAQGEPTPPAPLPKGKGEQARDLFAAEAPLFDLEAPNSPFPSGRGAGGVGLSDAPIREDAIRCLADAAQHWATNGLKGLPPEAVWEQLWSLLDEAGVLKKKKAK